MLKIHVHCLETHSIRLRLVYDALCREDGRDNCCERLSRFFYSVSSLCWKSINGIAGFSKLGRPPIPRKQQQLSCRAFSVIVLFVMAFGPHDPQTVRHLTSFCVDFLRIESTAITQETWRTVNLTLDGGEGGVTVKGARAYHQEGGGCFEHLL